MLLRHDLPWDLLVTGAVVCISDLTYLNKLSCLNQLSLHGGSGWDTLSSELFGRLNKLN